MKKGGVAGAVAALVLFAGVAFAQQSSSEPEQGMQGSAGMQQQTKQKKSSSALQPETVRKVQEALNQKGYHAGPADGKFGKMSKQALKDYQKSEGMQPTGKIDSQTLAKLGVSSEGAAAGGQQGGKEKAESKKSDMEQGAGAGGQQSSQESSESSSGK